MWKCYLIRIHISVLSSHINIIFLASFLLDQFIQCWMNTQLFPSDAKQVRWAKIVKNILLFIKVKHLCWRRTTFVWYGFADKIYKATTFCCTQGRVTGNCTQAEEQRLFPLTTLMLIPSSFWTKMSKLTVLGGISFSYASMIPLETSNTIDEVSSLFARKKLEINMIRFLRQTGVVIWQCSISWQLSVS